MSYQKNYVIKHLQFKQLQSRFLQYCIFLPKSLHNRFSIHSFSGAMLSALKLSGSYCPFCICAHILGGSSANVLQSVQHFMEPKPIVERLLPSSKNSHFQKDAKCKTFLAKMSIICRRIEKSFSYQCIRTWPNFETEARGYTDRSYCTYFRQPTNKQLRPWI